MRFCQRKNNKNIVHVGFFPPLKCKLHTRCPVVGLKFFLDIECNQRRLPLAFSVSFLEILFATYQTSNWCCKCGKFFFMSDRILTWRSVATTFMLAPLNILHAPFEPLPFHCVAAGHLTNLNNLKVT